MLRSVGVLSFVSLLQLVTQFALQRLLADRFGATAELDAFQAALALPSTLNLILGVTVGFVLVPLLSQSFQGDIHAAKGWRLAAAAGIWLVGLSVLISLSLGLGSKEVVATLYPGFSESTRMEASQCLRWLSWQLAMGTVVAWLTAVQNARQRFAWPAMVALMGALVNWGLARRWIDEGIQGYVWSVLASSAMHVVILVSPALRALYHHRTWYHEDLLKLFYRWMPLLMGGAYVRLDAVLDRYLGSYLEVGSISHLGFAQRFVQALLTVAIGGLLTVMLPNMSQAFASEGLAGIRRTLRRGLHGLALVLIPIWMGGSWYAIACTADLLQQGAFHASDTLAVAKLFRILLVMLVAASVGDLLARAFYSLGDTKSPTVIAALVVTIAAIFKWFGATRGGMAWLTLCTSASFVIVCSFMMLQLSRKVGAFWNQEMTVGLVKSSAASFFSCVMVAPILLAMPRYGTWVAAPVGVVVYGVGLLLLRESLGQELIGRLLANRQRDDAHEHQPD